MIDAFTVGPDTFDTLAAGRGDALAIRLLRDAKLSEHLILLGYVVREGPVASTELAGAFAALCEAQQRAPAVVADLLAVPWVGAWVARCARRLRGSARATNPLWADLAHLGGVAAVAAARAGVDAELTACVRGGEVMLPDLGAAVLDAPDFGKARIRVQAGRITISVGEESVTVPSEPTENAERWLGLRWLHADCRGQRLRVALDDLDPFRDCHDRPVARRLTAADVERWQVLLDEAWERLVRHAPGRAVEVANGLSSLVPLSAATAGPGLSVTSEDAFGGFALTLPANGVMLATTLVHEFQHSKLGAIVRLVPLCQRNTSRRFYAPWRDDPRPPGALLHGTYAFLGVTEMWRALRTEPATRGLAEKQFATLREEVRHALVTLVRSGCLTPAGHRFVAGMRGALNPMLAEPVPPRLALRARLALRRRQVAWHLRNRVMPVLATPGFRRSR